MKIEIIAKEKNSLIKEILSNEPQLNFNQLKSCLRKKDIKINQKRVGNNVLVNKDDKIEIFLSNKKHIDLIVAYEDDNLLIVNKPQGIEVTTKDKAFDKSESLEEITNCLAGHRIDKNTEGLVILAKTQNAQNSLIAAFKNGEINKKYKVIVYGKLKNKTANLVGYIVKDSKNSVVKVFDEEVEGGLIAKTNYNCIESIDKLSLLDVELLTGRTHQIRAMLSHIGLFVLGDNKYGDKKINKKYNSKKQCLCAYRLSFNFASYNPLSYMNEKVIEIEPSFNLATFLTYKVRY